MTTKERIEQEREHNRRMMRQTDQKIKRLQDKIADAIDTLQMLERIPAGNTVTAAQRKILQDTIRHLSTDAG